jgi:anaerobic selenocysteine-containing dehydrogenase
MGTDYVKTICFECHSRCGVILEVTDEKLTGIKGDKHHPFSQGYLCPKGKACMEIVYHPERITRPLVRVGPRGQGKFEPVSWDHAMEVISRRLLDIREKWGAEAFAVGTGTTRGVPPFLHRFMACYGSPNYFSPAHMSGGPVSVGGIMTMGFVMTPDYRSSQCMLVWAHNPDSAWPGLYNAAIREGLKNGAKLIVVDPRRTPLAKKADYWLRIRPGTDVALALTFLNIIIRERLYDEKFVENWTVGFDRLCDHVADFTPERCEKITWVPAKQIEEAAIMFAATRPACIGPGMAGASQAPNAFDLNRALASLGAITGNLEAPGGNPNFRPPTGRRSCYGTDFGVMNNLPPEQAEKRIGLDCFPIITRASGLPEQLWKSILEEKPYPVKGLGLFASNAMCAYANSKHVGQALSALDFLFAVDYFHTPTTALADVVLPPAHWTEREDVEDLLMMNSVFCQPKAIAPVGECRDEKQILIDLAKKMGLTGYWNSVEEGLDYRLETIGMRYAEFKEKGSFNKPVMYKSYEKMKGFRTPSGSGKVDLYSEAAQKQGASPLPVYAEPMQSPYSTPELYAQYPLILTTGGRNVLYYHSAHRNIASLRKLSPDPELDIHPETAAGLDLAEGEWARLKTTVGEVEIKIRFNDDIHPKVVHAPHGYWQGVADGWKRVNINRVTSNEPQCVATGSVQTRALLCRVEKMQAQAAF